MHDVANDIVSDRVHEEFAGDHVGRAATKDFHAEEGFEFAEMQLDAPTLKVEFAEGCYWVDDGIEKGGDDEAVCRAEAVGCKMDFNDAKGEGFGYLCKFLLGDPFGDLSGLFPDLQAIVEAKFFAFGHVGFAGLIESNDAVDAAFFEFRESVERAEASIAKQDVIFFEKSPYLAKKKSFVDMDAAFGEVE